MNYTTYHKLQKPLSTEKYNIGVHNMNADIIDSALNRLERKDETQDADVDNEIKRATQRENAIAASLDSEIRQVTDSAKAMKDDLEAAIQEETERAIQAEDLINEIIGTNKPKWDDKYTKNEIDNKFSALETNIDWKESVDSFDDILDAYPNPQDGWTVNVKDTDYTYRYNGEGWVVISANAIPKATDTVDGLLSKEDKRKLDTIQSEAQKNTIEVIKKNGIVITPDTTRAVDITIPIKMSELDNDVGFKTTDSDTWKANTAASEGYVASGNGQSNKVWKTDENGNPAWRDESVNNNAVSKSGDIMTGELNIHTDTEDVRAGVYSRKIDTGVAMFAGVSRNGTTHGLYSDKLGDWIIKSDGKDVFVNGKNMSTTYMEKNGITTKRVDSPGNNGYPCYLLMFDITTWYNSTATGQSTIGYDGLVFTQRVGGYMSDTIGKILMGVSWQKSTSNDGGSLLLRTSMYNLIPCIIYNTNESKYFLALKLTGFNRTLRFMGSFNGTYVGTWVKTTDANGTLPDGYEIVYSDFKYIDLATSSVPGVVKPDGTTTTVDADGALSVKSNVFASKEDLNSLSTTVGQANAILESI